MYEKVICEADSLIDSRYEPRDELYYLKGLSELKLGMFEDARKDFEHVINKYSRSKNIFWAHVGIGDSYLLSGNVNKAIDVYNAIIEKFPKDNNISVVSKRLTVARQRAPIQDKAAQRMSGPAPAVADNAITHAKADSHVSVQAGIFKNKDNADALARELDKKGYESYVETDERAGNRLYRVKAGKFRTKAGAVHLSYRLKRDGYSSKICIDE
jgi:tetratricopeptide (TPR) repeat protein